MEEFWGRITGFFDSLSSPAWGAVGAAAALVVAGVMSLTPDQAQTAGRPSLKGAMPIYYLQEPTEKTFEATPFIFAEEDAAEQAPNESNGRRDSQKTELPAQGAAPKRQH